MAKKSAFESKSIAKRLAVFIPAFYLAFFGVTLVVLLASRIPLRAVDVFRLPFEWAEFTPVGQPRELAPFIAMVVTFLTLGPLLIFSVVRTTKQCWDFTATLWLVHLALTCLVTLSFPLNWVWWVVFVPCGVLMSTGGELACYYVIDMREIATDHT